MIRRVSTRAKAVLALAVASLAIAGAALAATGDLTFVGCIEDEDTDLEGTSCSNAPGLDGAASAVAMSSNGASAYVASGTDDTVVRFSRNTTTGALTFEDCVEDEDSNFEGTSCPNAPGLDGAQQVALSPDGASVYVASQEGDAVVHFSRNATTGALSFEACIEDEDTDLEGTSCSNAPGLDGARGVALSADGTSAYVTSGSDSAIAHFSRDTSTGALTHQGCIEDDDFNTELASCSDVPGLGGANKVALSTNEASVYVTSSTDDAVAHFSRNTSTGALTFQACVEDEDTNSEAAGCVNASGLDFATGLALSPDGASAYVASLLDGAVAHFSRNTSTGALTFADCVEDEDSNLEGTSCSNAPGLGGANGLALSGDGTSVYVASFGNDGVDHFSRNTSTGALTLQQCVEDEDSDLEGTSCPNAPGLDGAQRVALSTSGPATYVTSSSDDAVTLFNREEPADAAAPPPPSSDGEAGDGPPDTTITKGPKDKTKKKTATFEFTSSEPGSTFECSLDGKSQFKPCTSPLTVKVKKGKHSFEVRATDPAGNTDPTPATDHWKVKRKRKS